MTNEEKFPFWNEWGSLSYGLTRDEIKIKDQNAEYTKENVNLRNINPQKSCTNCGHHRTAYTQGVWTCIKVKDRTFDGSDSRKICDLWTEEPPKPITEKDIALAKLTVREKELLGLTNE